VFSHEDRKQWLDKAFQSTVEHKVKMTFGELFLFHLLMQDYAYDLVGNDRFIPLMERNKKRMDSIEEV
jgi:hypothetical protein